MTKPLLNFRKLLVILAARYGTKEFDSKMVSRDLLILLGLEDGSRGALRARPKLISNDLRRLYMMGFLRRRKVKRECRTKGGKKCYRGYKYLYRINNQGWRYLVYLTSGKKEELKVFKDVEKGAAVKKAIDEIYKGDNIGELVWEWYEEKFLERPGYRRFPRKHKIIQNAIETSAGLAEKDEEIEGLKRELEERERTIEELKREKDELEQQLKEKEKTIGELKETIKEQNDLIGKLLKRETDRLMREMNRLIKGVKTS